MNLIHRLILITLVLIVPTVSSAAILWQEDLENCNDIYCSGDNDVEMYGRNNLRVVTIDGEKAVLHTNDAGDDDGGAYWRSSSSFSANELWVRAWVYYEPGFKWRGYQRWKMFYFQNNSNNPFYIGFFGDGDDNQTVSQAYVGVVSNSYGTDFAIPGYQAFGSTWHAEWDFNGQHGVRGNFSAVPGQWYCWVIHVKNASGSGKGDGELDITIYNSSGSVLFDISMDMRGSEQSGYNSYPYKNVMMDYTYNGGVVVGNKDYRDDIVVSTTALGFALRGGSGGGGSPPPPAPPSAPTNLHIVD
jgi:hypothetical protein